MSTEVATTFGTAVGALVCLAAAPYLAGLTLSVPERENRHWWRGRRPAPRRLAVTASVGIVLGGLAGAAAGWSVLLPAFLALAVTTTPLVVIDFEVHRLPNRLVFAAVISAAALGVLAAGIGGDWQSLLRALEGAAAVFAVLYLIALVSPRSFGYGDVKLGGLLGGYLGWFGWLNVYYGIFGGFVLGALVGIVLMVTRRATMKSALAFGPMLVLGALIVLTARIGS
jgi:leader peptidase (prepilin peptidase)/N-methyltransferase